MMNFDELLDRVTNRLRVDPELQREVRHELAGHLQDSTNEFVAAGLNEADAAGKAVQLFGDQEQLSQQLWDANRSRIPARKVVRFVGRYALAPVVAVASIAIGLSALMSLAVIVSLATN